LISLAGDPYFSGELAMYFLRLRHAALVLIVTGAFGFVPACLAQPANFVVRTDLECRFSVDGKPQGVLKPDGEFRLNLPIGEHKVEAVPLAGGGAWQQTVEVKEQDAQTVTIPLRTVVLRAEMDRLGYWIDPKTRLMWAAGDNGSAVSWHQAGSYCRALILGGYQDWTLPSIDDLQGIFGGPSTDRGYRVVSPLKLSGWEWSSSPGKEPGEGWAFDFGDGGRASVIAGDGGPNRALCVRRSGK
jgi:hypothetical protein